MERNTNDMKKTLNGHLFRNTRHRGWNSTLILPAFFVPHFSQHPRHIAQTVMKRNRKKWPKLEAVYAHRRARFDCYRPAAAALRIIEHMRRRA